MAFALLAVIVCANAANGKYGGGSGDSNNPFLIFTPQDLTQIGNSPDDWDKHFLLMSDVNMSDSNTSGAFPIIGYMIWSPYASKPFKGVFDGNKKRIINLSVSHVGHDFTGLFGYVLGKGALIKDLTLVNPNINGLGAMYTGAIAGKLRSGTVTGCSVEGGVIRGTNNVGGLVGYNLSGVITDCTVEATIYGDTAIGGITSYHSGNIMQNCSFSGSMSGQCDMGGLAGDNDGQIVNCYVKGSITGSGDKVAGLVGTSRGVVKCSYAKATVTGHQQTGGLIGRNSGEAIDCYSQGTVTGSYCVGGLVGLIYDGGAISRCYAVCNVNTNADQMGNLVGLTDSGTVIASFSKDNASEAELRTENTYTKAGWQFVGEAPGSTINPWTICEGMNYPRLSWEKLYKGDWLCPDGVDILDIALLCDHWLTKQASMDIYPNGGDGIVNFQDWAVFSKAWKTKRGMTGWNTKCDVWPEGGDGVVDEMDLSVFIDRWLTNGAGQFDIAPAFRGDQIINFLDFAAAAENYLKQ
ncbi:MAG: GLUG motif-containing protein [Sedimentisphaerales bacterium]